MKRYIILTSDIHYLGGGQAYLDSKCEYLERIGWKVFLLYAGTPSGGFVYKSLAKYNQGNILALEQPPLFYSHCIQKQIIDDMCRRVFDGGKTYDTTVVESHYDRMHVWGELLAARLGGKHMCFNYNEIFRGEGKYYDRYMDFFWFKYQRKELFGITTETMKKLFDGYKGFNETQKQIFKASCYNELRDVPCAKLEQIQRADWMVCYIGRIQKNYVNNVVEGVIQLANHYKDKFINFVVVGDEGERSAELLQKGKHITNLKITLMGNLVPLPLVLLDKIDVFIAGSGCALAIAHSAKEILPPIIIPSPDTCMSNGLLGYENSDSILLESGRKPETFFRSLERVLVDRVHESLLQRYSYKRDPSVVESIYEEDFRMIRESSQCQEYYPEKNLLVNDIYQSFNLWHKIKAIRKYIIQRRKTRQD